MLARIARIFGTSALAAGLLIALPALAQDDKKKDDEAAATEKPTPKPDTALNKKITEANKSDRSLEGAAGKADSRAPEPKKDDERDMIEQSHLGKDDYVQILAEIACLDTTYPDMPAKIVEGRYYVLARWDTTEEWLEVVGKSIEESVKPALDKKVARLKKEACPNGKLPEALFSTKATPIGQSKPD